MYIALTTFHYEMIPTTLLINLLSQRENVPFPAFVEAILMEGAFEIIREAGVRMPRAVGQTVSVVGALILGQAVVEAGIITPVMVIVVALTGIASFAIPAYNMAIAGRIIRFGFLILAGMFGFYGITLGLIVLVAHMNSLRSFGVPYLSPIVPLSSRGQKDAVLKCLCGRLAQQNQLLLLRSKGTFQKGRRSQPDMNRTYLQKFLIRLKGHSRIRKESKILSKCNFFLAGLLPCVLICLSLTGCWDSVELNRRAIVSGVSIDRGPTEEEKYVLSFQVIVADEISGKNARGTSPVSVYKGSGRTMFEALANASRQTARFLSLGHIRVVIISEKFAQEGIKDIMDVLERESETRLTSLIFISKGQPASECMTTMTVFGRIPANDLVEKLQTTSKQFGYNYRMEVDDIIRGFRFLVGACDQWRASDWRFGPEESNDNLKNISPKTIIKVTGLAAFKEDKLKGWLLGEEAIGTVLLKNKISQMPVLVSIGRRTIYRLMCIYHRYISTLMRKI